MSEETATAISMFVDLMIAALLLGSWLVLMSMAVQIGNLQQAEIDAVNVVKEYRKLNQYDNTIVHPQDVINLIFETRGNPEVWVDVDPSPNVDFAWKWTINSAPTPYTAEALATLLPATGTYTSSIVYDLNGAVSRFEFRR